VDRPGVTIRAFDPTSPADTAAVLDICVRTGDAGQDATGLHPDARALTDRYAAPYLALEPEWAMVAEVDGEVVGYLVGTPDTSAFAKEFAAWPSSLTAAERAAHVAGLGAAITADELSAYPAHLHIDLLPSAQGRGVGRMLVEAFVAELAAAGVPGLHLVVDPANLGAQAFYPRVGFERRRDLVEGVLFVRSSR